MRDRMIRDGLSGALAVSLALGIAELAAAMTAAVPPVIAVGDQLIDYAPGWLTHLVIDILGQRDKPALILAIALATLAAGAAIGVSARPVPARAAAGFAALGLAGGVASALDTPASSPQGAIVAGLGPILGAAVGWQSLRLLLRAGVAEDSGPREVQAQAIVRRAPGRRAFLGFATAAAGASATSFVMGRQIAGSSVDVEGQRESIALPDVPQTPRATGGFTLDGLAPLITPNEDFYRIDTTLITPRVDLKTWRLRVTGMVERPLTLTFDDLLAMPPREEVITLSCVSNEVGGDLVGNARWRGVSLAEVLREAGVKPEATQIVGRSVDSFTVGFPTEVAFDGRPALIAYGMNGETLPGPHGFPARLVVPGLYGYVSATKWLAEIELTTWDAFDAYWIPRGWAKRAPIKTQSRIDVPRAGRSVKPGLLPVAGVAWAGDRGVAAVEVRVRRTGEADAAWRPARLSESLSGNAWRQWVVEWQAEPGDYVIEVRATDGRGEMQTDKRQRPDPDGATGWHRVEVRVRA